ncbi:NACHT and WD repeat domain-containing protein 2-like [Tigriopus californicus]|uniref:NACHT and WD repeat domain-containing protein 2-like n=1 Tax=Tigriopus californicus TaxID=6832 RepID=UPI0027DA4B0E|nr:NACHT and WD repeat domain-containing protein 2-like [Tigriopus californicus]
MCLGDQVIDGIFVGRLDHLPNLNRPLVRIYISSTYTDMVVEKNILLTEVYPKLKDYCREQYGLEFQVVDMRWGVRDESTDDHMTTDICLEEIRNCQKSSIGPNFIFLGGQKYGYRPIPNRIDVCEFEMIIKALRDLGKDESIFLEWYDIDSNSVPPEMILQPISTALPNFLNSMAPKLQETDQKIWWNILCTFQNLFQEAALYLCKTDQISMERMKSFQHSVIEREVHEGIIRAKETKGSSLAFLRKINNINLADQRRGEGQKAMHYVDIKDTKQDKEASQMMSELTELKIPERLERHNWKVYELDWVGMSGQSKEGFDKYMTEFIFDYYKSVIRLIDKAMRKTDNSVRGTIANEILIHLHQCVDESKRFHGRENELFKIKTYTKGSLRKVFIVYGPTGSGKSCLIAKVGCSIGKWLDTKNYVLAVRFLGTTPNCSNVTSSLLSICQQLCYNLEIPIEDIPEEFVPLKNFFRILLDQAGRMDLVIVILLGGTGSCCSKLFRCRSLIDILDALETFFVNSYENGATSWIPKELPENVKIILSITQEPGKTIRGQEVEKFLKRVAFQDSENLLEIGELGPALSQLILTEWLQGINRKLNNFQWRVVMNALHICSLPLFLYLCFLEVKNWKSYFLEEETKIPLSIDMTISNKYEQLERRFGKRLVGHALGFITASKLGLSESELEDILCLDDLVLTDVFHNFIPQVRRIPPILWTKIRREIQNHFIENEADGVRVLVWAHKHFRHASRRKYLNAPETRKYLHSLLCDYFLGIFSNGKEKPYRYTEVQRQRFKLKGRVGQADRRVPVQPNVFTTDESNGKTRYNLRKFSELPYHLVKAGRSEDLCHQVLFNYQWIHSKISARPIDRVLDDFAMALAACAETEPLRIQILLVMCAFRLSRTVLDKFPDMIAPHLVGRLLPSIRNYNLIRNLILQCDSSGLKHNCLSPLSHCMESPGGPLLYSLEGHRFAIFGCSLTNDKRYVVSISTRLISWDLKTSEVCRDIDPQPTGIMLGMALSDDSQYAAAFTSSHQLIIVDVMMGNYVRVERVMAEGDPIEDISFFRDEDTDAFKIAVYNHKYFRIFDIHGQHVGGDPFAIDGNDILSMILLSSQKFVSIHWSGDLEFDDKRIWIRFKWEDFTSKLIECMHCVELLEFGPDGIKILTADRSVQNPIRFEIDPIGLDQSWSIVQRHYNGSGTLIQETAVAKRIPEAFGLHAYNESEHSVLVVTVAAGFILLYNQDLLTLKLPRSIRNVRVKINQSNPCVIDLQKLLLVAGVRRDIFIWSIKSEMLLRSFRAHNGRILAMSLVQDHHHNLVVTSSLDKTIKVWDASRLLTVVPVIKRLDFNVEKLVICEELNMVVSQTRKSLGFWNLDSGALDFIASESPDGYIQDVALSTCCKFFITAEETCVQIWSLTNRIVLHKLRHKGVFQVETLDNHVIIVGLEETQKEDLVYRINCLNLFSGTLTYKFQTPVQDKLKAVLTGDKDMLAILGYEKTKEKDVIFVHHAKKGLLLHKIQLKYPNLRRPLSFIPSGFHQAIIIDPDKGKLVDIRNKSIQRSCKGWTGQGVDQNRFGLSASNSGGLSYMDLKTGKTVHVLIPKKPEGVFTVKAFFSKCGDLIFYYHSERRTMRVFRKEDGKQVSNYFIQSEVTSLALTNDGKKLILGTKDGSVIMLVISNVLRDGPTECFKYLQGLVSRQLHHTSVTKGKNDMERDPIIRFRAIARTALHMDRVVKNMRATRKDPLKSNKTCLIS